MPTPSRILFHLSRLTVAVLALSSVGLLLPGGQWLGSGWRGPGAPAGCARHGVPQPAEARALRERAPRKGPPSQTWWCHEMFFISPLPQSALVALRLGRARGPRRAACALRAPQRPKRTARVLLGALSRPRRPHAPPACHARPKRPADGGQAHTAPHCAPHLAEHQATTEAGPGAPREAARGRLPSVRPRAAVRPARPRAGAPHRVPHPAPQRTLRRRGRFRSPSTRSSLAQRQARDAPAPPHARRAHRARACASPRLAKPRVQDLWKVEGTADAYLLRRQFVPRPGMGQRSRENDDAPAPPHARRAHRGPRGRPPCLVDPTFTKSGKVGKGS